MPAKNLSLEEAALNAFATQAAGDLESAMLLLDEVHIEPRDFENSDLGAVWALVSTMVREGRTPDFHAVVAKLPSVNRQVLHDCLLEMGKGSALERLRLVRDSGQRRRVAGALRTLGDRVSDRSKPIADVMSEARAVIDGLSSDDARSESLEHEVTKLVDHLDEVSRGNREPVLASGIAALDSVIGGLLPTLIVLGALPGVGKSAVVAAILKSLAERKIRAGVFSLEDEKEWIVRRIIAAESGVPVFVMNNRVPTPRQVERAQDAAGRVYESMKHIVVDDRPGLTAADIVASAKDMIIRQGVKVIFVDHLGEIRVGRGDRHDLEIGNALQQLRSLAKIYRVPVFVACHLRRRDGLDKTDEPKLTDFAFSAAVERMCRVGLGLSKTKGRDDQLFVYVLKQTGGMADQAVPLDFDGPSGLVVNRSAEDFRAQVDARYAAQEGR